jgi:uncharacterized flavoprotein (TIGR03862 family)
MTVSFFMNLPSQVPQVTQNVTVAIVGGGPAGLMAAELLSTLGHAVHLFDAMPSVGRKFLLAGKGGLNLTHAEPSDQFVSRYGLHRPRLETLLAKWGAPELRAWAHSLDIETFVGTSGRVFPKEMKAAPLLRAWLQRLRHPKNGPAVQFHMRHKLTQMQSVITGSRHDTFLDFHVQNLSQEGTHTCRVVAKSVILALGGGSWARLGSDGAWVPMLQTQGVPVQALQATNCGFHVAGRTGTGWTPFFENRFAGHPLKSVTLSWTTPHGEPRKRQGEFVATAYGLEGSLIYTASADLREQINSDGTAVCWLDLLPDRTLAQVTQETAHPRGTRSLSSHLKSRLGLEGVKMGLLNELLSPDVLHDPVQLARAIKAMPVTLSATRPMDEAISTAGGVDWDGLWPTLETKAMPGVFCAGEMVDWEAPTGGYLLTASMSTGVKAAQGVHQKMKGDEP